MSFNSNVARVEYIVTNTNSLDYSFNFQIYTDTDLLVYKVPANTLADDTLHKINLITNYTVTINGDTGGFIKLTANPILNDIIVIERNLPINRTVSYTANGGIYSDDLNTDQNYQTYLIADESLEASRALQLPKSSTLVDNTITSPEPGAVLRWDVTGTKVINDAVLGTQLDYVDQQLLLTEAARDEAVAAAAQADADVVLTHADVASITGTLNTVQPNGQTVQTNVGTITNTPVSTNINTVATNTTNINIVAGVSVDVTTIATNIANVNAVGADLLEPISEINTVATDIANVNAVGLNITNVNTNATNIVDINTNATNIVAIQGASANAAASLLSANNAATSASNALISETNANQSAINAAASAAGAAAITLQPKLINNIEDCVLDIPFKNSIDYTTGSGYITYSRTTVAYYINSLGILTLAAINEPRFDKNGIILEGASTNIIGYSSFISNWTLTNSTLPQSNVLDPTNDALSYVLTSNITGTAIVSAGRLTSTGYTINTPVSVSFFAKKGNIRYTYLTSVGTAYTGVDPLVFFDLDTGLVGTKSATVNFASMTLLANGWYRCEASFTNTNAAATETVTFGMTTTDGTMSYASTVGDYTYMFGAQAEMSSSSTSYIATATGSLQRAFDSCYITTNTSIGYNTSPKTIVFYAALNATQVNDSQWLSIGGTWAIPALAFWTRKISSGNIATFRFETNHLAASSTELPLKALNKFVITISGGLTSTVSIYCNDILITQVSETTASHKILNNIYIGGPISPSYGSLKNLKIYDRVLSNQEMVIL